jgi:hypothetical protein
LPRPIDPTTPEWLVWFFVNDEAAPADHQWRIAQEEARASESGRRESMEFLGAMSDEGHAEKSQMTRGVAGLLAVAVFLRLVRALQNYPMWCDETMLAANLLGRDWTQLAVPLAYRQVCPLGFLALEWLTVRTFGFSELTLRLVPLVCALASVPLFHLLARRLLGAGTSATLLAVAIFAVSEPLIRYAAESKPYASDLLVSLVLLNVAIMWLRAPDRPVRLWAIAAMVPLALVISLPAVFTIGAIALCGLNELLRRRAGRSAWAFGGFVVSAGVSVAVLAALGQYRLRPGDRQYFLKFWAQAFPPSWRDPAAIVRWLIHIHTGPLFALPHGSDLLLEWLTPAIAGFALLGLLLFARTYKVGAALLVGPAMLTLGAAAIRRYPYGVSVRVNMYLVPAVVLLAALGATWLFQLAARAVSPRRITVTLSFLLAVYGACRLANDLGHPYRTPWDRTAREFARWFWEEMSADAELVCVRSDLGIPFRSGGWAYDGADQYLCYQRIYSRRHREGHPPRWEGISATRPLRCVLLSRLPEEVPDFRRWIAENRDRYTLKDVHTYPATRGSIAEPALHYVVCEFVPTALARASGRPN